MSSLSYYYHTTRNGSGVILSYSLSNLAFRFVFADNQSCSWTGYAPGRRGSGLCFWSAKGGSAPAIFLVEMAARRHSVFVSSPPTLPHRTRKNGAPFVVCDLDFSFE